MIKTVLSALAVSDFLKIIPLRIQKFWFFGEQAESKNKVWLFYHDQVLRVERLLSMNKTFNFSNIIGQMINLLGLDHL